MSSLGILSAYSAYSGHTNSAYSLNRTSFIDDKQGTSDAQKSIGNSSNEIMDKAIISDEALALSIGGVDEKESEDIEKFKDKFPKFKSDLTPEEEQQVEKLKTRDAEVKAHEQAHIAASAGINASAPTYEYEIGPDGQKYAVGGEVNVSFTLGKDPEENIAKAEAMKAAALAPSQPSGQDMATAKAAEKIIEEAKQQLTAQQEQEFDSNSKFNQTQTSEIKNSNLAAGI